MEAYTSNLILLTHSLIDLLTDSLIIILSHGSGLDLYICNIPFRKDMDDSVN